MREQPSPKKGVLDFVVRPRRLRNAGGSMVSRMGCVASETDRTEVSPLLGLVATGLQPTRDNVKFRSTPPMLRDWIDMWLGLSRLCMHRGPALSLHSSIAALLLAFLASRFVSRSDSDVLRRISIFGFVWFVWVTSRGN